MLRQQLLCTWLLLNWVLLNWLLLNCVLLNWVLLNWLLVKAQQSIKCLRTIQSIHLHRYIIYFIVLTYINYKVHQITSISHSISEKSYLQIFGNLIRLRTVSFFLENQTSKRAIGPLSVTCEWRLHWFHATIWMPGTLVTG